ncbi:MAG: hypothetical protein KC492_32455 [Myxococcales bacterium]|nr:hypothetical protein [Myxococcales bacterium]
MRTLILFLLVTKLATAAEPFEVVRKSPFWRDQHGTLRIEDAQVCFAPKGNEAEARCWSYTDIQHLDWVSPTRLDLLSYEDVAWKLGRDRLYRFELVEGELSEALFSQMRSRSGKPVTDRVPAAAPAGEEGLPAKQLKIFGGSEGQLFLSPEQIVYRTDAKEQARAWRMDSEVESVWSSDPYRIEVHVYEGSEGAFRQPKVYKFELKKPLDRELYRRLKQRLYALERGRY